jgi:hypothetical protein
MWVNAIQIRAGKLSDAEMAALGGPSAAGIPILLPAVQLPPTLSVSRSGSSIVVTWAADVSGFTLQSSPTVEGPTWTTVNGVTANSATIPATSGNLFLRLIK